MKRLANNAQRLAGIRLHLELAEKAYVTMSACNEEGSSRETLERGRRATDAYFEAMFKIERYAKGGLP